MKCFSGNPVSDGIAIGSVYVYTPFQYTASESYVNPGDEAAELQRYEAALRTSDAELDVVILRLQRDGDDKAKIFIAHKEILADEEVDGEIRSAISDGLTTAEYAVYSAYSMFARLLSTASDPLIAARGADLTDVRNRLLRILCGKAEKNLSQLPGKVIVVAHDMLPSDTATLDRSKVLGIITEIGGSTSHSAIIARSYEIPAVLGVSNATHQLRDGDNCILDALEGKIYVQPDARTVAAFQEKQVAFLSQRSITRTFSGKDCRMADGKRIHIGLNVGSDENSEDYNHCDFVGLLRTEFLYMHSDHLPTEDEQYQAYARVIAHAAGKPVTLRTLDIGGDKTLEYMPLPKEENPFLGNRALRLCLENPQIFNTQLRAALRASVTGPLQIMFPMVASIDDIRSAKAAVEKAKHELRQEGIAFDENIPLGIMIEIPAIAEIADLAAQEVDFASVGTNDLTQYTHAVDRMNPHVAQYYQSFSPAMFRILRNIFKAFRDAGKPVSVCGELGGNPMAVIPLVGLGLSKTSMSGSGIAKVKQALSRFTGSEAREIGEKVCSLATQGEIMEYLKQVYSKD